MPIIVYNNRIDNNFNLRGCLANISNRKVFFVKIMKKPIPFQLKPNFGSRYKYLDLISDAAKSAISNGFKYKSIKSLFRSAPRRAKGPKGLGYSFEGKEQAVRNGIIAFLYKLIVLNRDFFVCLTTLWRCSYNN